MRKNKGKKTTKEKNITAVKEERKKRNRWLIFVFSLLAIIAAGAMAYFVAYLSRFYSDWEHPIGDEVAAMMGKIKYILNFFPHFNWYYEWDGGQPGFWIYLPFPFFVGALLVKIFHLTLPHSITLLGLISYILIAIGIYGITHRLSKNRLISLFAAALAITSQGIWYWDGAGYYARTFGMGFYFIAFWTGIALVQKIEERGKLFPLPKVEFFLTILFFFLTAYSHTFSNYLIVGTLLLLFLMAISGWSKKIFTTILVIGAGIFLSAFYYFLLIQANLQYYHNLFVHRTYGPHYLRLFFNLNVFEGYAGAPEVSPLILPLVALLLLWFIFSRKRFQGLAKVDKRIFWLILIFFIVSLYYPLQGSIYLPKLFYIFLLVGDATFLVSAFGAIIIGIILASVLRSWPRVMRYIVPIILLAMVGAMTVKGALFTLEEKWPRRFVNQEEGWVKRIVIDPDSKQYRMGTTHPQWAEAFNYFYEVPQNRDYFAQGVVYSDWQFWQQAAIWDIKYDYEQTDYLIDWFSLKWILTTASGVDTSWSKLSAKPEKYEMVYEEKPNFFEFIPKKVSPILSATNVPTVLVVGEDKIAYDLLVRATASFNLNSQNLIPVRGKEYIDQYSLDELKQFSLIYLYEYKYRNKEKVSSLLKQYVENGGGLIVEGMLSPENLKSSSESLFDPLPKNQLIQKTRQGEWGFQAKEHEITKDVNFNAFAPAIYEETNPWKIVTVKESPKESPGFETIVSSKDDPVLLASALGKGKVIWTGFNLNFHLTTFNNEEEKKLFRNILSWISNGKTDNVESVKHEADFINPERREITIDSPVLGVLNKEYYFPAWKAYYEKDGKKTNLKIYRGGLDQQYIPLPDDLKYPVKVVMQYGKYPVEKVGFVVSCLTFIVLIIFLFEGIIYPPIIGKIWKKTLGRMRLRTINWWDKDEE